MKSNRLYLASPNGSGQRPKSGKMLLEVCVGYFGQILLQLSHKFPLGRRVERVAKLTKNRRRRDEHEAVKLITRICLTQRRRNLMDEVPFVCPVQIFAWLNRVASRHGALMRSAGSVGAELLCVAMDFG